METEDEPPDKGGGNSSVITLADFGMREVIEALYGAAAREQDEKLLDAMAEKIGKFGDLPTSVLTDETKRLELKAQVDQVIDQVKAKLTLESLAIPFGVVSAGRTDLLLPVIGVRLQRWWKNSSRFEL